MNENSILTQLSRRDMDRIKGYRELLDFYNGQQWEGRERRGEKHLTFNYAKVFIDKVTSYLMSGVNFAVDAMEDSDEARARAQSAEQALYQVYEHNNLEQLDFETEISNMFAVGDGAGVSRGLVQASASGVVAAREILRRSEAGTPG